jgi:rfaE bifunctional protein kinase chain/domain
VLAALSQRYQELLPSHQAVLFSDYGKGGLAHVSDMIGQAKIRQLPVLIDPKGSDYSRYRGATVITPNRTELREVIGPWRNEAHLEDMAQNLRRELGLHSLLLTRSEEGMSLYDDAGAAHVAAQAREVFDVTGAGDTVIATLAALLGAGMSLREALPWANKAGGIVVGKFGTAAVSWNELTA